MGNNDKQAIVPRGSGALVKRTDPAERRVTPVADIHETVDAFIVKLDMPGAVKESITVSVEPGYLSAKGSVGSHFAGNSNVLFSEIGRKSYFREFNLTEGIDHEEIAAEFEDGVLTIRLPKSDQMKAKNIPIK